MAATVTTALKNLILDHLFGGPDLARPATLYLRLSTTIPTQGANGTEPSTAIWTNYVAEALTNDATLFPAAVGGVKANNVEINLGPATTTADVTLKGWEVWTHPTAGIRWLFGTLPDVVVQNNNDVKVPIGSHTITISDPA